MSKRAVLYSRVSTTDQADRGTSLAVKAHLDEFFRATEAAEEEG